MIVLDRTKKWSLVSPMKTRRFLHMAAVFKDHIYVCGGQDGIATIYRSCEIYDPSTDTWSVLAHTTISGYLVFPSQDAGSRDGAPALRLRDGGLGRQPLRHRRIRHPLQQAVRTPTASGPLHSRMRWGSVAWVQEVPRRRHDAVLGGDAWAGVGGVGAANVRAPRQDIRPLRLRHLRAGVPLHRRAQSRRPHRRRLPGPPASLPPCPASFRLPLLNSTIVIIASVDRYTSLPM